MGDHSLTIFKRYLSSVPAIALNYSCRLLLANNLECKQTIQSEKGFIRDYRGLADLMGFQYHEVKAVEEFEDRTLRILETWETRPDATLDKLISYLEDMDRHDVIEDLVPLIKRSVDAYIEHENSQIGFDIFVKKPSVYDAYVSYADEDSHVADEYAHILESPKYGLNLFVRGRDRLDKIYWSELDTDIDLIKKRCRRILILLTENFMKSTALDFLVSFEGSLETEQKHRTLIPVIVEPGEIPPVLLNLTKIDLTKDYIYDCMWSRLVSSLLPEEDAPNIFSAFPKLLMNRDATPNSACIENRLAITFPQSEKRKLSSVSNSNSATSFDTSDSFLKEIESSSERVSFLKKTDSPPNIFHQFLSHLKKKIPSTGVSSTSISTTVSSTSISPSATNTFHSQTSSDNKLLENSITATTIL